MNMLSSLILPADIRNFSENETLYKNLYTKVLIIIGIPMTVLFTIFHLIYSRHLAAGLVFVMFLSLCFLLFDFIKKSETYMPDLFREISIRVFLIFFIFSQMYGVWVEQTLSSIPWFLLFPMLIFFSTNIKEGLIWSSCIAVLLFYSLFLIDMSSNPDEIFQLKTRLIIIFGILAIITLIISGIIRSAMQMLFDNAKVTQAVNLRLKKEIEEHKQAEETLRKNEEKFRLLTENANDVIWTIDMGLNYNYISPAIEKVQGWNSEEAALLKINDVLTPLSLEIAHKRIEANLVYGSKTGNYDMSERLELELYRKDGTTIWTEISASFILGEDGKPLGILGVTRDITERKNLEDQLFQAQKMESIGTLAGGIAHDFNNILFPIMGHTEMLLEDEPEDSQSRSSLKEIHAATLRAKDLVKQILTFSRQESSELKLMKMQPIIKEALKLIRSTIPSTIEIKHDIQTDCGVVKADPTKIHQIVMNLATNAYHAMEKTGGELKVSLKKVELGEYDVITPDMIPGEYVCLTVSDTGTGIDKAITKKIFDPFFTTKSIGKGTGMGLSVIHGIVIHMGGDIQVHSKPGKGTQFHIYLPAEKSLSEEQVTNSNAEIQSGTEQILLVDDEQAILSMEKKMLERLGYQVTSQISSVEALEMFRANSNKFDLVITDMAMPNMSGDKLSAELVKINPDIPILLCTGFSENMSEKKAKSLGIKGFILKPIVMKDFSQKIGEVLDKN